MKLLKKFSRIKKIEVKLQSYMEKRTCVAVIIEVTSVINLTQGARPRWKFVYQIYPPAIDTLVTGMAVMAFLAKKIGGKFALKMA